MYDTYSQDQAHIPDIQTPAPRHTMQELIQEYGRGMSHLLEDKA